jgi:hypothetical protein
MCLIGLKVFLPPMITAKYRDFERDARKCKAWNWLIGSLIAEAHDLDYDSGIGPEIQDEPNWSRRTAVRHNREVQAVERH